MLLPSLLGALAIGLSLGLLGSGGSILTVGILGSLVGQRLGRRVPQAKLRGIFGWFLVAIAIVIGIEVAPRLLA